MASKRKFKRDYIILEAKDTNFRYKERVLPKAFAKVEVSEEKSIVALYLENIKYMRDGYRVVAIQSDYEVVDLGNVMVNEQGKGDFVLELVNDESDIKAIAITYDRMVPLIGFKGNKIDNYEELLFADDEDEYEYIEVEDDEEYEYIEVDENYVPIRHDSHETYEEYDYEEIEYIEIEDDEEEEEYEFVAPQENRKFQQEQKQTSSLLMPRQIKKGLKYFKEVKPFVCDYIEDTRWWKIEINPTTLCGYTMPYLGYVNSLNYTMYSDIIMNSYKYRHYLFGVQYDEYNKRKHYIYGIPGKQDEQPDKGFTGFVKYQACDTRNDSLGYWLCFIDPRTRRIIK